MRAPLSASSAHSLLSRVSSARMCCPHHSHDHTPIKVAKLSDAAVKSDYAFEMISSSLRFGRGVTKEVGMDLKNLKAKHTLVVTDKNVENTIAFKQVESSLKEMGINFTVFNDVKVEPSDKSMVQAIDFAKSKGCDSFVAVGGGSVMDTTKAAALYSSNPAADFLDFVGPPFGKSLVPENPMLPLIAVPTTSGTGSETTGAAIMDFPEHKCKSGIRLRCIKPMLAIIDPLNVMSMPRNVAIYSGFDVLCHALESYTAVPYHKIMDKYFRRSVFDPSDEEARTNMLMASSFAGMGFGNAGVHICHGLSYPISSQGKKYTDVDYPPSHPLIPHGLSVVTTAVADFAFTTFACPDRHREAARALGAEIPVSASSEYIANTLCDQIKSFMSDFKVPNGLSEMGFSSADIPLLTEAALHSVPNIAVSPRSPDAEAINNIYERSMKVY